VELISYVDDDGVSIEYISKKYYKLNNKKLNI